MMDFKMGPRATPRRGRMNFKGISAEENSELGVEPDS